MSKKGIYYDLPDKYKYSIAFNDIKIKPIVSEEHDKYLALASSANLKKFLPKDLNVEENISLLSWAGNFCVVNKLNLNDDAITNEEAYRIIDLLPYTFADLEHSRSTILGCILTAGFSEYGTDKPLTREEVKNYTKPFNITAGGIIWRIINPDFAEEIEKMGEPDARASASLSWEIAFDRADLILIDKDKSNLEDGKIITEASEIEKLETRLKSFGGTGYTEDGKRIGRIIRDDTIPLGVGFVSDPAGQVGKIVTNSEKTKIEVKSNENDISVKNEISANVENDKKTENSNSQSITSNVKETKDIKNSNKIMIKHRKDITDESLKEANASQVLSVLDTEIEKISQDFETKKNETEKSLKASQDKAAELESKIKENEEKLTKATEELEKLAKANQEREEAEVFNTRMNYFDGEYDLSDEKIRNIVARKIKGVDEKQYEEAKEEIELILAAKKKLSPEEKKKMEEEKEKKGKESKASVEDKSETTVDDAIDNGDKTKTTVAATTALTETVADKWAKAFGKDNWEIDSRAVRR